MSLGGAYSYHTGVDAETLYNTCIDFLKTLPHFLNDAISTINESVTFGRRVDLTRFIAHRHFELRFVLNNAGSNLYGKITMALNLISLDPHQHSVSSIVETMDVLRYTGMMPFNITDTRMHKDILKYLDMWLSISRANIRYEQGENVYTNERKEWIMRRERAIKEERGLALAMMTHPSLGAEVVPPGNSLSPELLNKIIDLTGDDDL